VAQKLRQLQAEQDSGVQPERGYTVQHAVDDWLAEGLDGRSAGTVTLHRHILKPVTAVIGHIEVRQLTGTMYGRPWSSWRGITPPGR
jgi:hypothetical protein